MNYLTLPQRIGSAALGLLALAAASATHARTDVHLSIGIPAPYVQPAPVYVQPQPVYVQPRPVYVQPQPVYVEPQPVYGHPRRGPWGDRDRDGIPNIHDRWDNRHHWHRGHRHGHRGDADRDGVPNRYDRFPNHSYRY